MPLREELEQSGNWLFRWRSYLPLILLVPLTAELAAHPRIPPASWQIVCGAVAALGLLVRAWTIGHTPHGTSGRNTRQQVAESLNTTGAYSLVRHPLYVGNYLMWLGIALFVGSAWVAIVVSLAFWLYYERIMLAEEEFLRRIFGQSYEEWAAHTPAFIPSFRHWTPPALPFSLRNVLRREYSGLFATVALFTLLVVLADLLRDGELAPHPAWYGIFAGGLVVYLTLRTLKRHTRLLDVEGR